MNGAALKGAAWEIEGLVVRQGGHRALDGAGLVVRPGEVLGVLGPNGSGKTTLLRAGLGLLRAEAGAARLSGRPVAALSEPERARLAGYLPQERRVGWNLAALEIAALGAPDLPVARARAIAAEALGRVGLAGFERRGVLDMSGGERARVLLARLLATRAPLLIADEPAAGLDPDAQFLTLDLLRQEAARGAAVVVTLHDLTLAARGCDRLLILKGGRVAAEGPPAEALSPAVLRQAFGLDGELIQTPAGPVVAARRLA
ncbi:ABC transporter ATP-binding protein [Caulobacter mirabilis]|uniref:Iron ABC transporter ATP-binding protein n=1 Tax=Caulobacter mirabilis TaxID=69666 RepID=A0A2D2AXM2_9CAUL|nr:ABC transporter ATP-binding protein [Caulobacter mirabilis]ATQ42723.1 iron ABC transporter ATP-binding protein [Caulobacter mirabilis]